MATLTAREVCIPIGFSLYVGLVCALSQVSLFDQHNGVRAILLQHKGKHCCVNDPSFLFGKPRHSSEIRTISAHAVLQHVHSRIFDNGTLGSLVSLRFDQICK